VSKRGYLVVEARSSDPGAMGRYRDLAQIAVEKFGGCYLIRGGAVEVLEGKWQPERLVVVEFDSPEKARAFYDSPEYRDAREARQGVADFQMLLAEGY
jgi:uncharacterized protein (DUF1330 family)